MSRILERLKSEGCRSSKSIILAFAESEPNSTHCLWTQGSVEAIARMAEEDDGEGKAWAKQNTVRAEGGGQRWAGAPGRCSRKGHGGRLARYACAWPHSPALSESCSSPSVNFWQPYLARAL